MAGIGFVLRKLVKKVELSSIVRAYLHATLATSGPWLVTVIELGIFYLLSRNVISPIPFENFRLIILYNFSFSLVISTPLTAVAIRYLADLIYKRDVADAVGMMFGVMIVLLGVTFPMVTYFYFYCAKLEPTMSLLAIVNFLLVLGVWTANVFLSALKYYTGVTVSFVGGLAISIVAALMLARVKADIGMMIGFNLGLAFILASLVALIFSEYPKLVRNIFKCLKYLTKFWDLALGVLFTNIAIWVDKWIMWFAPESDQLPNHLVMYPHYDSAMFISYLTIVPVMSMFLIIQETSFFEHYLKYYRDIQEHANFEKIQYNHKKMMENISYNGRNLVLFQCCICLIVLISLPRIFDVIGMNYIQIGIFRNGVLGATFQIFSMYLMILLSYFDYRKGVLLISIVFLVTNVIFTYITLHLGFAFYGYGFFLSSLTTFITAAILTERYVRKLPYHTFLDANASVD